MTAKTETKRKNRAKKTESNLPECQSCKARLVVNGVCNACGVVQTKDEKPKKDGPS